MQHAQPYLPTTTTIEFQGRSSGDVNQGVLPSTVSQDHIIYVPSNHTLPSKRIQHHRNLAGGSLGLTNHGIMNTTMTDQ